MAEIIRQNTGEDALAMRYGGDEFVIFGSLENGEMLEEIVSKLREGIQQWNRCSNVPYELGASIGTLQCRAGEIINLDAMIEQADQKMYEEKRIKHTRRAKDNGSGNS